MTREQKNNLWAAVVTIVAVIALVLLATGCKAKPTAVQSPTPTLDVSLHQTEGHIDNILNEIDLVHPHVAESGLQHIENIRRFIALAYRSIDRSVKEVAAVGKAQEQLKADLQKAKSSQNRPLHLMILGGIIVVAIGAFGFVGQVKWGTSVIAAGIVMMVLSMTVLAAEPWLMWVGGAFAVMGVAFVGYTVYQNRNKFVKTKAALVETVLTTEALMDTGAVTKDQIAAAARGASGESGVQSKATEEIVYEIKKEEGRA